MKRICIGLLTALGCIAVATALIVRPFSKKSIQSYVLRNQDELTNYARKVIEEHLMGPLEWNEWMESILLRRSYGGILYRLFRAHSEYYI